MGNKEVFATRLKATRIQTGKTQKEFASMVKSTAATISAYENATKNPSMEIVINIAQKCNISIDWLCGLSETRELKPKIENYKDVAIKILELFNIDMCPDKFELKEYEVEVSVSEFIPPNIPLNDYLEEAEPDFDPYNLPKIHEWALRLPDEGKLSNFVSTYNELSDLLHASKIKQNVIDTWLNGALEELAEIPVIKSNRQKAEQVPDNQDY